MELLPFAGTATLIVMSPGPDLALVLRGVLSGGRRVGLLTGLGIATGSAIWAIGAIVGLAALLSASPGLLGAIRWLGAGYLAWMGVRTLISSGSAADPTERPHAPSQLRSPFRTGLVGNLLHPGQVVFYTSMLPQFIDPAANPTVQGLVLGAVFVTIVGGWFSVVAVAAARMPTNRWVKIGPALTRITGLLLVGFAVRLWASG